MWNCCLLLLKEEAEEDVTTRLIHNGDVEWAADTTTRLQLARFHEGIFETRNINDFKPFLDWRGADDE